MKKKQVAAYYTQLRVLITRAKEDAERWERREPPLLLKGISETSVHDFFIYDRVYNKFIAKLKEANPKPQPIVKDSPKVKESEPPSKNVTNPVMKKLESEEEIQLARIADALERIANSLENK